MGSDRKSSEKKKSRKSYSSDSEDERRSKRLRSDKKEKGKEKKSHKHCSDKEMKSKDEDRDKHQKDDQCLDMASRCSDESSSASNATSNVILKWKSNDVGWEYGMLVDSNNLNKVKCKLCGKVFSGGVYRMKEHVGHIYGNVTVCPNSSREDQDKCKQAIVDAKTKKKIKLREMSEIRQGANIIGDDEDEIREIEGLVLSPPHFQSPLYRWSSVTPPDSSMSDGKTMQRKNINEALFKEKTHNVRRLVARWVYESDIPFSAIDNDSFLAMIEAIGQFGPGFKPPSQYELREPLLNEEVKSVKVSLKKHEEEWRWNGCSIMIDVWNDKRRSIMNLCVNCKEGTSFLSSKESSDEVYTSEHIFEYVMKGIEQVGSENVVQVITDNASNNMAAAKMLKEKMPTIFWTSCATHTVNLMLENIGKLTRYQKTIDSAKAFTIFVYAHHKTLSMMRLFTKKRHIVRPGISKFASSFLTLQSLMEKKENLRTMFASQQWDECKWAKHPKGKDAFATVMSVAFWNGVTECLKVFAPLVRVFQLVNEDRKSSLGFLYGELRKAKEEIKEALNNIENNYRPIFEIIDSKTKGRLDSPLHLTAYLLNPYYYYKDRSIELDANIMDGMFTCLEAFYPNDIDLQSEVINKDFGVYMDRDGDFDSVCARKGCEINNDSYDPVSWWSMYGNHTPHLQKMAKRILSLTTSSFGCERNWNTFERIHMKKMNRLDVNQLNNLVFVSFNAKLKNKHKREMERNSNVLLAKDASNAQEWIVENGDDEIDHGSGSTWNMVGEASGIDEMMQPQRYVRNVELREHDEDDFVSSETKEGNNIEFESDEEHLFEGY